MDLVIFIADKHAQEMDKNSLKPCPNRNRGGKKEGPQPRTNKSCKGRLKRINQTEITRIVKVNSALKTI